MDMTVFILELGMSTIEQWILFSDLVFAKPILSESPPPASQDNGYGYNTHPIPRSYEVANQPKKRILNQGFSGEVYHIGEGIEVAQVSVPSCCIVELEINQAAPEWISSTLRCGT